MPCSFRHAPSVSLLHYTTLCQGWRKIRSDMAGGHIRHCLRWGCDPRPQGDGAQGPFMVIFFLPVNIEHPGGCRSDPPAHPLRSPYLLPLFFCKRWIAPNCQCSACTFCNLVQKRGLCTAPKRAPSQVGGARKPCAARVSARIAPKSEKKVFRYSETDILA